MPRAPPAALRRAVLVCALVSLLCARADAQALLFSVTASNGRATKEFGPFYGRTSTFGTIVDTENVLQWQDLTFIVIDVSGCDLNASMAPPNANSALLIPDQQPSEWARTCTEVQMCARAAALGYRALLVSDTSGQLGPMNISSDGRLHGMRGVAPELASFVGIYVAQPTGMYLFELFNAVVATNISFLVSNDTRNQQEAWLSYYVSWVTAACVTNGLLVVLGIVAAFYLPLAIGVRVWNNSYLALCAATASALLVVIFAGAAYQRARPFLSTPGYAVLADLNEAFQVVALVLYVQSWAAAAASITHKRWLANKHVKRGARYGALAYLLLFFAVTIARGYVESMANVPPLLNLAVLVLVVAAFLLFGALVVRGVRRSRGGAAERLDSIVRRTVVFLVINTAAVVGKLVLVIVALAEETYLQETYDALLLFFDTLIVANIIVTVVAVIPVLRATRTGSTQSTPRADGSGQVFSAREQRIAVREQRAAERRADAASTSSDAEMRYLPD